MRLRMVLALVMALVMGTVVGGTALAKGEDDRDTERRMFLTPTATGSSIGAIGEAKVRTRADRNIQKLEVTMFARRVNGQTFRVFVTNAEFPQQRFLAGRMLMQFGSGTLELTNEFGARLPQGVAPVTGIENVVVKNSAGATVMRGSF